MVNHSLFFGSWNWIIGYPKKKGTTFIMTTGGQWDDMTENGVDGQRK
jgi:hypothetical protein